MTQGEVIIELVAALKVAYYGDGTCRCGIGPMGDNGKTMPHAKFAALSRTKVRNTWDYSQRLQAHKVAKALVLAEQH